MYKDATAHKLHMAKVNNYLLAERDTEPYYVAVHVPGSKVLSSNYTSVNGMYLE